MRFPVWMTYCQRVTQLCVGRRSRNIWLLAATLLTLIVIYSNSSVKPSEPHVKRSHSPSSGDDSVSVVYAPDDDDDDDINNNHDKYHEGTVRNGRHVSESPDQPTMPVSHPVIFHSDRVRIRETPFDPERNFEVFDWDESFGLPLELPPSLSGDGFNATIPLEILKIIADVQENDTKSKPQLSRPAGDHKKPGGPSASLNASSHQGPRTWVGQNISHELPWNLQAQKWHNGAQLSPQGKKNKQTRPQPKFAGASNASSEVLGAEFEKRSKDVVTKPPRPGKPPKGVHNESGFQNVDAAAKPHHASSKSRKIVDSNPNLQNADPVVKQPQGSKPNTPTDAMTGEAAGKPSHGGKARKGVVAEASLDTEAKPPQPGRFRKAVDAQTANEQEHQHKVTRPDAVAGVQSELVDPDESQERAKKEDTQGHQEYHRYKAPPQHAPSFQNVARGDLENSPEIDDDIAIPAVDPLATVAPEIKPIFAFEEGPKARQQDTLSKLILGSPTNPKAPGLNKPLMASHTKVGPKAPGFDKLMTAPPANPKAPGLHQVLTAPSVSQKNPGPNRPPVAPPVNPKAPAWTGLVGAATQPSEADLSAAAKEAELVKIAREKFNFTLWKGVQKERKKLLRSKCEEHANHKSKRSVYDSHSIVDKRHNFLYCPVEKSASTFFRRFMYSLVNSNRSREITSPFKVPIETALAHKFDTLRTLFRKGQEHQLDDSVKFVVVREPFSRLFSAYVDKLLVPNSYYWKEWGVPIVSAYRHDPSKHSLLCGNDVTFPEFVKYVIDTLHGSDEHVEPVNSLCSPCDIKYSVIAHMETLTSDFEYLTSVLKVSIANYSADALLDDVTTDAIMDSTYSAFTFLKYLNACVSKHEMCQRLWRKMQLRGIISDEMPYPLTQEESDKVSAKELVGILLDAKRKSSLNTGKLRQQKYQALKEAFEKVPTDDVLKLAKIYSLDFELFGYSKYPSFLDIDF